ncbi:MAG: TRAP transporter small permease [Alphaproteobacteria bacterium]|nr:TRAP transporter small permease [Alphaproteobacteria bacterium]
MAGIVGYGVALRYIFNQPQVWGDELVSYMIVLAVMLGAAEVLRRGEHIAIDILTERLDRTIRRWIEIAGMGAVVFVSGVLVVSGLDVMSFSWEMGVRSVGYLAVPMWLPLASLPLGFGLLGLAAVNRMLRLLRGIEDVAAGAGAGAGPR